MPHHFTARFGRPTNAVQEHGTMGTKAKPSGDGGSPTALLFEPTCLTWVKDADCDWLFRLRTAPRGKGAVFS